MSARYYRLFDGGVTPGGPGEYSHSSQYTPMRQGREGYIRRWVEWRNDHQNDFHVRFRTEYVDVLQEKLLRAEEGEPRIPLTALSLYLQARVGPCPDDWDLEDLTDHWRAELYISQAELENLFDITDWQGASPWQSSELLQSKVLSIVLEHAKSNDKEDEEEKKEAATGGAGQLYALDWSDLEIETDLLGADYVVRSVAGALKAGKHIILVGPPGTGKTQLAEEVCKSAVTAGVPGYFVTTATADWSTFETIGGYFPSPTDPSSLRYSKGIVIESIETGRWLVIDELNRADIDKALGELFTVFSGRRVSLPFRDADERRYVVLPPGEPADEGEIPLQVQSDWRILGTMNSFDKASLFQLSFAFMRRFAFVQVPLPEENSYEAIVSGAWPTGAGPDDLREAVLSLVKNVFLPDTGVLGRIGLGVGPAIPLDILRYLRGMGDLAEKDGEELALELLVGLEMFLFPQLEGQDRKHKDILDGLTGLLVSSGGAESVWRERIGRGLSLWTGFEAGNGETD